VNKYQRITLVLGAIVLVIALWTTPKWVIYQGSTMRYDKAIAINDYFWKEWDKDIKKDYNPIVGIPIPPDPVGQPFRDSTEIAIRTIGILGATVLIFFALKGAGNK